jgi:carbamoyl-phosphate synthase large subunit
MILGGGPNRIGQGIEFDYCCCHASYALRAAGFETIMVNSNPETVSTDYDTSDRLYFEPLTREDVLNIIEAEQPEGVIIQFGGQTPLKLSVPLLKYLQDTNSTTKIWGTSPDSIDIAEDRERFEAICQEIGIMQPNNGLARSEEEAVVIAQRVGYPVVVRPSYVLGGRGMEVVYSDAELEDYMRRAIIIEPEHPVLIDHFLEGAIEVDVDAIADQLGNVTIGGIMEHIEEAGIHSGDSACSIPTFSLPPEVLATIRKWTISLAKSLNVIGLMNIQYAVQLNNNNLKESKVFILEANPRASRTVPYVSKAINVPLVNYASRIMAGATLAELCLTEEVIPKHISIKEAVLPFAKFAGTDTILGPEMRSTGEVMGIDTEFGRAFAKAQLGAGTHLPLEGTVFISVNDRDKSGISTVAEAFVELGFKVVATEGTHKVLRRNSIESKQVLKVHEGRPNISDIMKNGQIQLIVNSPSGEEAKTDGKMIRRTAMAYKIPVITTLAGAKAAIAAIKALQTGGISVTALQDYA